MLRDYLPYLQEQIVELSNAWDQRDFDEVAKIAHSIKGSAGTFGLEQFTEPAAKLQHLATERQEDAIEAAVAQLVQLAEAAELEPEETPGAAR